MWLLHRVGGKTDPVQAEAIAQAAQQLCLDHLTLLASG